MQNLRKIFLAEFFGTMVLVICGCGTVIFGGSGVAHLSIAMAFGLSVVAMAYTVGPISGCHLNPAVSLAIFLIKKMSANQMVVYMLAQCLGAAIAGGILVFICHYHVQGFNIDELHNFGFAANGYGVHSPGQYGLISCLVCEVILTAIFAWVVLATTRQDFPVGIGGLVVGLALVLVHLVGIQVTGTSVNPARSLGVALYKGGEALSQLWLFILAPMGGALLASVLYKFVNHK